MKYLSPSSLNLWRQNKEEFFLKYLVDDRPPRIPQTQPMSVGSAFDAYVKAFLNQKILGGPNIFNDLFIEQVDSHNRDFAIKAGAVAYTHYKENGLGWLLTLLEKSTDIVLTFPKYEAVVVSPPWNTSTVPLCGVPDLQFRYNGIKVILDWKINGYCSINGASLKPGHINHKDFLPEYHGDICINGINHLEKSEKSWAEQLSVYSWISGGGDFIGMIEQIAFKGGNGKTGHHRCRVSNDFQKGLFDQFRIAWKTITSGHIFDHLPRTESDLLCDRLRRTGGLYTDSASNWLMKGARGA